MGQARPSTSGIWRMLVWMRRNPFVANRCGRIRASAQVAMDDVTE
jgi:hypothetical protein